MKANKDIIYGNIEITEDDLKLKNAKVRVNTWIDGDIVQELKKRAKNESIKYQTLLNQILRKNLFPEKKISLEEIMEKLNTLEKRVG